MATECFERVFTACRHEQRKALIVFVSAGDPNLDCTEEVVVAAAEAGADIIELGVPFSDPMADGPTIQEAGQRALAAGTTLSGILSMVKRLRQRTDVPLILFSYYNVLYQYGVENLAADAAGAGINGVLVVDIPLEEIGEIEPVMERFDLPIIRLLAPTTPSERVENIVRQAEGFIYCITVTGITGARHELPEDIHQQLEHVRAVSPVPVVAGFGISTPDMARMVGHHADGVVVGSALVKRLAEAESDEDRPRVCREFVSALAAALRMP